MVEYARRVRRSPSTSSEAPLADTPVALPAGRLRVVPDETELSPVQLERRRLARGLHDLVAQSLTTMLLDMEEFKSRQAGRMGVLRQIDEFQSQTREALDNVWQLVLDLRDENRLDGGFVNGLRMDFGPGFEERTGIRVRLTVSRAWPSRMRVAASEHLRRIIHEAVQNARRHGGARRITIAIRATGRQSATVTVSDDGRGMPEPASRRRGMGIVGMSERAAILGGRLDIESGPGRGTTVRVVVPRESLT